MKNVSGDAESWTWADAFGLWHAVIPDCGNEKANRRLARALILWELQQRAGAYQVKARAVPVVLWGTRGNGDVHYREADK